MQLHLLDQTFDAGDIALLCIPTQKACVVRRIEVIRGGDIGQRRMGRPSPAEVMNVPRAAATVLSV